MRALLGVAVAQVNVTEIPEGTTATFLSNALNGATPPNGSSNYVRAGLVWDTRDREVHTSHGTWADLLVEDVSRSLGSDWNYTRATLTVRQYAALSPRVTFAERVIAQNVAGDAPFYDLAIVQTSFTPQEGLGGANTLRGLPQDRYVGKGLALSNSEVRWRAKTFTLLGKPSTLTLSGFVDAGRAWTDRLDFSTIASGLHVGYGGGVRVGRGPNFVVALDVGHSTEAALPIYIGLGFLF
jgi:outer membrane protein assembly factor BamA